MIVQKNEILLVRGNNVTEESSRGDIDRITFPLPLLASRMGRIVAGIDILWLQEAICDRLYLYRDDLYQDIDAFSMFVTLTPIAAIYRAVNRFLSSNQFCFSTSTSLGSSLFVDPDESSLAGIVESLDMRITEPAIDLPPENKAIVGNRIFALEKLMEELAYAVVDLGHPTNTVGSDSLVKSGSSTSFDGDFTTEGTHYVYMEMAEALLNENGGWDTTRWKHTANLGIYNSLKFDASSMVVSQVPIVKSRDLWVKVKVYYTNSNTTETHFVFIYLNRSFASVNAIDSSDVSRIINVVNSRFSFNMNPASLQTESPMPQKIAFLSIQILKFHCICEMRDQIVQTR